MELLMNEWTAHLDPHTHTHTQAALKPCLLPELLSRSNLQSPQNLMTQ